MGESDYWGKSYNASLKRGVDTVHVIKASGVDRSMIRMQLHDKIDGTIQLRSQEHAEQLHFLLGQMLGLN